VPGEGPGAGESQGGEETGRCGGEGKGDGMTDNEKEIARINGEARKRGLSYGQFVSRTSCSAGMPRIDPKAKNPENSGETTKKRRKIRHV
jgi:hypothetical protein